jgi:hypothetical protein
MKYWEIIADNLRKAGWSCGCISSTDQEGRQFWVVAAEREDAGRFVVRADEKLSAFLELESRSRRDQIPASRKSWTPGAAGKNIVVQIPDRRATGARLE